MGVKDAIYTYGVAVPVVSNLHSSKTLWQQILLTRPNVDRTNEKISMQRQHKKLEIESFVQRFILAITTFDRCFVEAMKA